MQEPSSDPPLRTSELQLGELLNRMSGYEGWLFERSHCPECPSGHAPACPAGLKEAGNLVSRQFAALLEAISALTSPLARTLEPQGYLAIRGLRFGLREAALQDLRGGALVSLVGLMDHQHGLLSECVEGAEQEARLRSSWGTLISSFFEGITLAISSLVTRRANTAAGSVLQHPGGSWLGPLPGCPLPLGAEPATPPPHEPPRDPHGAGPAHGRPQAGPSRSPAGLSRLGRLETIDLIASGVLHDLPNLMQGIISHAELLCLEPGCTASMQAQLGDIRGLARIASDLAKQLAAVSRQEGHSLHPLDLNDLIDGIAALLLAISPEHIDLRFERTTPLPRVSGEATLLRQLLVNLVLNAVEATRDGVGTVVIRTGLRAGESGGGGRRWVTLDVIDQGHGIPIDQQDDVFLRHYSTKGAGRGVGLAYLRHIAEIHGGRITVRSEPGTGSCFRVELPAADPPPVG